LYLSHRFELLHWCSAMNPELTLVQNQWERFRVDSIIVPQHSFGLIPKMFTTIAMILTLGKVYYMINPLMVKRRVMPRCWVEAVNRGEVKPVSSPTRYRYPRQHTRSLLGSQQNRHRRSSLGVSCRVGSVIRIPNEEMIRILFQS